MKQLNNKPLVSIIMPVYNGERFICEAIESVCNQTYKNLEIIIVDDGSTDRTKDIIQEQACLDNRIKPIFLAKNQGEAKAANIGFRLSKAEFIARQDADDISYPTRIEKQVEFMVQHPEIIVLGAQADVVDENGTQIGAKSLPLQHEEIYKAYGTYHPIVHSAAMFRRSLLPNKHSLWKNHFEPNVDYYTFFSILPHGKFANLKERLVAYRIHNNNKSIKSIRNVAFNILKIRLMAVLKLGYRPTLHSIIINLLQLMVTLILPARLIMPAYFIFRGIKKPSDFLSIKQAMPSVNPLPALRQLITQ